METDQEKTQADLKKEFEDQEKKQAAAERKEAHDRRVSSANGHQQALAGLTKREFVAAKAMTGQLAGMSGEEWASLSKIARENGYSIHQVVAKHSVEYADALLLELERSKPS